ncbi:MAG: hypothetical protein E6H03_02130 [Bacillati bacterium ANGP1]|uniref:Uncharacterized protein n=1 Tax=Candidatus Segetimicrobium genomatis TaxID=2569760 RepID=A0A537JLD5_9BACT|nr:MAG: hypothetical protein E6H03_02130 [Terrabacteria group bacterium ANGP1]
MVEPRCPRAAAGSRPPHRQRRPPAGQPSPATGAAGSTGPTKKKFNPADYYVIGDQDTKLLYQYSCSSLPAIEHPAFFLIKWQAFDRGYKPATICPPP